MKVGVIVCFLLLLVVSTANATLMFAQPPWFNVFVGELIAATIPWFGVMIGVAAAKPITPINQPSLEDTIDES